MEITKHKYSFNVKKTSAVGERFSKLVAIKRITDEKYLFQCDCGNTAEGSIYHARRNNLKSCGCLLRGGKFTKESLAKGLKTRKDRIAGEKEDELLARLLSELED